MKGFLYCENYQLIIHLLITNIFELALPTWLKITNGVSLSVD